MHNDIICALAAKKAVILILLDLSAAFDTVDHTLLLRTLTQHGITGVVYTWFESYLCNRSQHVYIDKIKSDNNVLDCGVPQGSVLGPLLFTLYTASLGRLLRREQMSYHLYADDTQLYIAFEPSVALDSSAAVVKLEKCVNLVREWMVNFMLKMNDSKTEVLVISNNRTSFSTAVQSIVIGNSPVTVNNSARNIGLIMDSNLSLEKHIKQVCRTCSWQLRNIGRLRPYLDRKSLETLVHAFVSSHLDYCNSLFIGLPNHLIERLQHIQNSAARIVTGTRLYDHITPVLRNLHWQRIQFKVLVTVFKSIHGLAPCYLSELITRYKPTRSLRSSNTLTLAVPFTRSVMASERAFSVAGPRLWNALPSFIQSADSLPIFKRRLKTILFQRAFDC